MLSWRPFPLSKLLLVCRRALHERRYDPPARGEVSPNDGNSTDRNWKRGVRRKLGNGIVKFGNRRQGVKSEWNVTLKHKQLNLEPIFKLISKRKLHWYNFLRETMSSDISQYQIQIWKILKNQHSILWNRHPGSLQNSSAAAGSCQPVGYQVKPVRGGKQIRFS